MAQGGDGAEQRQSRSSGFSGLPTLGEALLSCRGLDFLGLQLCVWFKSWNAILVLKVTSDLWPEGLAGQLSWASITRGLSFQAVV